MTTILEARDVNKSVAIGENEEQRILKDINLQLKKGEFVSIMGPSGSGKSTLLYNISGMDQISAGSVFFNGKQISAFPEKDLASLRLTKMGFIFQNIHLLKNLNLLDNIILSAYLAKNSNRDTINNRAMSLMKKMGIDELAEHNITQASGGQLQRIAICRALINNPDILFGDEPTGALNSKSTHEIMDILGDINATGTTILLVTHDVKVAARSERVLFMMDGNLVADKNIGKYDRDKQDLKARESRLGQWLTEMGF
ncbi:ABC transporter ATP-binding protein [Paenibacillus polysaccharolyticus]|uniref:ABC transporter ATP-binding protein n=2 Tax=Paenibacillus TaxID=44249 RepID=A0ABS7KJD9_9BACL|nr:MULTISPECIES: ABC transporter ATP-binding protein [Paenibacillus]MDP9699296.1 putative ABC transport system ATP-binding protein [Paenibacillus intestini]MBY0204230.1 ABC transporter ATP-binding protein [Paenibacillus cucumis (ex Kampfer et al. 2016)]MCM3133953.1 ABC transporter ATP-binding protein [Paenibacillus polysaccharolyticus]MCP1132558.1 ABC transporter ATP-binding protein [Paenibacillus polysaccharolyticus]SCX82900.1 putative ABC transport system ATP-binding protein [Paenibacillus p